MNLLYAILLGWALAGPPLDLNKATAEQLGELPGLGPTKAAAIVQWRTDHGAFTSVEGLLDVPHIGPGTVENLRRRVVVRPADAEGRGRSSTVVDINQAPAERLVTLPGVGPAEAAAIIEGRPWESCRALERLPGIGPASLANLAERCTAS